MEPLQAPWPGSTRIFYVCRQQSKVCSSDFGTISITQFSPDNQSFIIFPGNKQNVLTLEMNGDNNHIWAGQQGADQVVLFERLP